MAGFLAGVVARDLQCMGYIVKHAYDIALLFLGLVGCEYI
jgi:hypothetical protein